MLQVGIVDVVRFAGWFYRKIERVTGLEGKVLTALVELLTVYHLDDHGRGWRLAGKSEDSTNSSLAYPDQEGV